MIVCQVDNGLIMIVVLGFQLYYIRNELQYKNGRHSCDLYLKGREKQANDPNSKDGWHSLWSRPWS